MFKSVFSPKSQAGNVLNLSLIFQQISAWRPYKLGPYKKKKCIIYTFHSLPSDERESHRHLVVGSPARRARRWILLPRDAGPMHRRQMHARGSMRRGLEQIQLRLLSNGIRRTGLQQT